LKEGRRKKEKKHNRKNTNEITKETIQKGKEERKKRAKKTVDEKRKEVMKICAFHSSVCVHCNSNIACIIHYSKSPTEIKRRIISFYLHSSRFFISFIPFVSLEILHNSHQYVFKPSN